MSGRERGIPNVDPQLCTSCGRCAQICPTETLVMVENRLTVDHNSSFGCIACGQCATVCAGAAIGVTGRRMKADDSFALAPESGRATAGALKALLEARRSVRRYQDKMLDQNTIHELLQMASTAPMGFPPSEVGVVVVNGKQRVQELAEDVLVRLKKWQFLSSPLGSVFLKFMMDKVSAQMMRELVLPIVGIILERRQKGQDVLFYNAPCVLIFHYPMKDVTDPVIACSYATIAAESMGLGSCIIGTVPPAFNGDKALGAKWGIPAAQQVSIVMTLGFPAVKYSRGIRRRFASVSCDGAVE